MTLGVLGGLQKQKINNTLIPVYLLTMFRQ